VLDKASQQPRTCSVWIVRKRTKRIKARAKAKAGDSGAGRNAGPFLFGHELALHTR
jgi:hypothetical protein